MQNIVDVIEDGASFGPHKQRYIGEMGLREVHTSY
jgi:hypothetical protein